MDWNIKTTFVISDLHFYHKGLFNIDPICKEIFGNVEGRVKLMTEWWNEIVKPSDSVIMLGDISFHKKGLQAIKNLNGLKYLIRGNHDLVKSVILMRRGLSRSIRRLRLTRFC